MDPRLDINPLIHHGVPIIRGTRVPVARLVGAVGGGDPIEQVASDYGVTVEDVRAALRFAAELIAEQQYRPLPKSA